MKQDFDYVAELITDFFNKEHIIERFEFFKAPKLSGWETWLQIEFAYFLENSQHFTPPEWWRENTLPYDYRKEKEKLSFRPDFLIRKKGCRKDSYSLLEIKQAPSPVTCMNRLLDDMKKISKIKPSALDVRSFLGLAVFQANESFNINDYFESVKTVFTYHQHENIKNTGFVYLLFEPV